LSPPLQKTPIHIALNSMEWRRRARAVSETESDNVETVEIVAEKYVIVREDMTTFAARILDKNPNPPPLRDFVKLVGEKAPGKALVFLLEGMKEWVRGRNTELNREFRSAVRAETSASNEYQHPFPLGGRARLSHPICSGTA